MKNKDLGNNVKQFLTEAIQQYFIDKDNAELNTENEKWFITTKFLLDYIYHQDINEFLTLCSQKKDKNKLERFLEVTL